MNPLTSYLIELNVALTIFFLAYKLFFQKDANFRIRRMFLLSALLISAAVPFMHFSFPGNADGTGMMVITLDEVIATASGSQDASANAPGILHIIAILYTAVSAYFLVRLLTGLILIAKTRFSAAEHVVCNTHVYASKTLHASSFFYLIFIDPKKLDKKETEHIVKHEILHAKLFHSFDRIIMEIILILAWFNPVTWFLRKAIIINHEYQADNEMIEQGTDQVSYQLSILNQYIGSASITNQFSTHIKNRIVMLNKNYKKGSFWKGFVLIPVSILLIFFIACSNDDLINEGSNPPEEKVFFIVDEMPTFNGGDPAVEFRKYIGENLNYPLIAGIKGVSGRVIVQFKVNEEGEVEDAVIVKSVDPALDKEALEVVMSSPDWEPGKHRGEAVNVVFTFPINFVLNSDIELDVTEFEQQTSEALTRSGAYSIVEEMPKFNGGEAAVEFRKYIGENLEYPEIAKQQSISGRVIVQFIVNKDGKVADATILRSVDPVLDKEAIRVVMASPEWTPGKQKGQAVDVKFTFPITFKL